MSPMKWCGAIIFAASQLCLVRGELVMVYSLQRNGARQIIAGDNALAGAHYKGGPSLLPEGRKETYDAGVAFRNRYIEPSSCGETCLTTADATQYGLVGEPNVGFTNYNTFANSSALSRTLLSATSFFLGVFGIKDDADPEKPYNALETVPVFTVADSEDYEIRGYTKCPNYDVALKNWYKSEEFKQKEKSSQELRDHIKEKAPFLDTSLENMFEVFETFNSYIKYGVSEQPLPDLSPKIYNQLVQVAMWVETSRLKTPIASNLLGGALLGDVLSRINGVTEAFASNLPSYYKLLTVSGHYNTQLSLLAALGVMSNNTWAKRIPAVGSVLAIELHKKSEGPYSTYWIRFVGQDGPESQYEIIPLSCDAGGALSGACKLEDFLALATPKAFNTAADWCTACGNTEMASCTVPAPKRSLRGA